MKVNTKKFFALFLSLMLIITALLTACGGKEEGKKTPDQTDNKGTGTAFDLTPDGTLIKVWLMSNNPEDPEVNEFCRMYPEYQVDNSVATLNPFFNLDYTSDLQRLGGAIAAGDQPDLFLGYMAPIEAYYSNLFMPVHDYLTHDPEYNFDTVEPKLFDGTTFNGKVYFVPTAFDTQILIWSKDLFESMGLDPDTPPKTWSEFMEFNEKLVSYDSEGKLFSLGAQSHLFGWDTFHIIATGKHYTDETGLTVNLNTDSYVEVLEFIKSISKVYGGDKMVPEGFTFFTGRMGMAQFVTNGVQVLPTWIQDLFDYGIGPLPKPDDVEEDYLPLSYRNILCIPKKANNPKGGWLYIKYQMTDAAYAKAVDYIEKNPKAGIVYYITHIPTREKLYNEFNDFFTEKSWELINARDEQIQKANVICYDLAVHTKFANFYLKEEFPKFLNDEIPAKEFLEKTEAYLNSLLKEFKEQKIAERWKFNDDGTVEPPPEE